jgi:putative membrane protein
LIGFSASTIEGEDMTGTGIPIPYCGAAPAPAELLARWNLDPAVLAILAAGLCAVWLRRADAATRRRALAALVLLAFLFVSPFCALTSALFSARAVHHLAMTALAAPLLAALLPARRPASLGALTAWTLVHAGIFWFWHAPAAYAWALSGDSAYWLMQASLLLSAFLLWRAILHASVAGAIAALLATMVQMGLLGALLGFSGAALYAPHLVGPLAWGLSPLEDQQLAGLVMWVPGAGLYLGAALMLLARWFAVERRAAAA